MYINPFLAGVLATVLCELVIVFVLTLIRGGGE
jgi:hypothetical protein